MSLTIWGTSDDKSWLTSSTKVDAPLLFDPSLKKKPAYWAFVDPLQLPGADLSTTLTAAPTTVAAGQGVVYTITVTNNADQNQPSFAPTDDDLPAANVAMTMAIPSHTGFQSLTAAGGLDVHDAGRRRRRSGALHDRVAGGRRERPVRADGHAERLRQPDAASIVASANVTSATADPNPAPNNTRVGHHPGVEPAARDHRQRRAQHHASSATPRTPTPAPPRSTRAKGWCRCRRRATSNVNAVGTYAVTYSASDSAGGQATPVTRTVQVADTTPPQLGVIAGSSMSPPDHRTGRSPSPAWSRAATDSCDGTRRHRLAS